MNIHKCFHVQAMIALVLIGATARLGLAAEPVNTDKASILDLSRALIR